MANVTLSQPETPVDPSLITASGPGLTKGVTGEKCVFMVIGTPQGKHDGLSVSCDGPAPKPDVMRDHDTEDPITYGFVPITPGDYKIVIRWKGRQINGSPFKINVTGEKLDASKLISKVTVHGRAFELGKAYSLNEFVVDCREVRPAIGALKVHVVGPSRAAAQLNLKDNKNGTFSVKYKPTSPGMYTMSIKIMDADIPGSPFQIRVTEFI